MEYMESKGCVFNQMINTSFWKNKNVFITGHTGFKGTWLSLWLKSMGANVTGYSLLPPTSPSLFDLSQLNNEITSFIGDIRDHEKLEETMVLSQPDIVIHMAAQPLVRDSYKIPVETYSINTMGTVHLFEAIRKSRSVRAVVNVTTDKCYENQEWVWGYRENEPLGGFDPYSSSKACSELITSSYRNSFFNPMEYGSHGTAIASARAGNVIGGGDWATDRLIPDCIKSLLNGEKIAIRYPKAIRPWQHVLEPLNGYLMLAKKLYVEGPKFGEAWNFGPDDSDTKTVEWIVKELCTKWGNEAEYIFDNKEHPHEANYLKLDCSKARFKLDWHPKWSLDVALDKVIEWAKAYQSRDDLNKVCLKQIKEYMNSGVDSDYE
jgi:CDP-glucose 4,6-dehydratase